MSVDDVGFVIGMWEYSEMSIVKSINGVSPTVMKRKGAPGRPNEPGNTDTWLGMMGENVRRHRHLKAWSLSDLAEKSDVEMTFLSEFERGIRDISVSDLIRVIIALGVKITDVVPPKLAVANGSVVGCMSASWLAEACLLMNRSVCSVFGKVSKDEQFYGKARKRNRVGCE